MCTSAIINVYCYYYFIPLQSRYPLGLWPWQVDQESSPSPLIGDDELHSLSWSQSKRYRFSRVSFPGQQQVNDLARRRVGRGGRLVITTPPLTHTDLHTHTTNLLLLSHVHTHTHTHTNLLSKFQGPFFTHEASHVAICWE